VNGVIFSTAAGGTKDCIATFFAVFPAFNLAHLKAFEAILELFEYEMKFRRRVTRRKVKTLIA
jgi:hypothetical protein